MSGVEIRDLRRDEIGQVAVVVARGMRDNPLHVRVFGDDADRRERRLVRLFQAASPAMAANATVIGAFRSGKLVGVAAIFPPGKCQPSTRHALRALPRLLPLGPGTLGRMGQWRSSWQQHDMADPHWHLGPVAVNRDLQGQGIGTALLSAICARLDQQGATIYLETDTLENVRFYEKSGFHSIAEDVVLGVPNWFMCRPAGGTRRS